MPLTFFALSLSLYFSLHLILTHSLYLCIFYSLSHLPQSITSYLSRSVTSYLLLYLCMPYYLSKTLSLSLCLFDFLPSFSFSLFLPLSLSHYSVRCLPTHPLFTLISDVDECSKDPAPCEQNCKNAPPGTYTCSCNDPDQLDTDNRSCISTSRIISRVFHYHHSCVHLCTREYSMCPCLMYEHVCSCIYV